MGEFMEQVDGAKEHGALALDRGLDWAGIDILGEGIGMGILQLQIFSNNLRRWICSTGS